MLDATSLVGLLRNRRVSCREVADEFLASIEPDEFNAWAAVDPEWLHSQAALLDGLGAQEREALRLFGVPLGMKDNLDTAALPTEYGSPIYAGWRPSTDAAVVTQLRRAGAMIVGKTKLAEFAWMTPPDTRNPISELRTPGGSSSGSAAAVAAGTVPIATGTQTAGSINRPASYCGIVGFKPTFGRLPRQGLKILAPSLDTVGLLARTVEDLKLAFAVFDKGARVDRRAPRRSSPPRLAFARTPVWNQVEQGARDAIEAAMERLRCEVSVEELVLPERFNDLVDAQTTIQYYETAQSLRDEFRTSRDLLSVELREALARGAAIEAGEYRRARLLADQFSRPIAALLEPYDGVITPSATGVPPVGLSFTGDPLFSRVWTLIGAPSLSLPLAWNEEGLPVGLQLVGAPGDDWRVLAAASWVVERAAVTTGSIIGSAECLAEAVVNYART